jgi:adenosylcobinamide amidohydrolase
MAANVSVAGVTTPDGVLFTGRATPLGKTLTLAVLDELPHELVQVAV